MIASQRMRTMMGVFVLPALLVLPSCTTSAGFRARWYVIHSREQPEAPAELTVLLDQTGTIPRTVKRVRLNDRDSPPLVIEWEGMTFRRGDWRLALIARATPVGGQHRLPCTLPVRLFVELQGGSPLGGGRWAEVPIDGELPSTLPDEWLHCSTGADHPSEGH